VQQNLTYAFSFRPYQGTVLRMPIRTSRARASESKTAQLSRERRRLFAGGVINTCSDQKDNGDWDFQERRGETSDNNSGACSGRRRIGRRLACFGYVVPLAAGKQKSRF
jgi:hypothetical protein